MECVDDPALLLGTFKAPSNFVISGATSSGKTTFLLNLLRAWPFSCRRGRVLFFYECYQPLYEEFMRLIPDIRFIQGLNEKELLNDENWTHTDADTCHVCIFDDLFPACIKSAAFEKMITVLVHHKRIITFTINQNLFSKGSQTLNRNTQFYILCRTNHISTLDTLGLQIFGAKSPLKAAFMRAMNERDRPCNYLLVDLTCEDYRNRLQTHVLPEEQPTVVYRPGN